MVVAEAPIFRKRALLAGLVTLLVVAATAAFAVLHTTDFDPRIRFGLTDHRGTPVDEADFQGSVLLVFFGFTHCPRVCPTELARLSRVLRVLEQNGQIHAVTPLFVSIDPARDSVSRVASYLEGFHPRLVGLTGSTDAIAAARRSFGAVARGTSTDIVHSSVTYVVDAEGRLVDHLPVGISVDAAVKQLSRYL